MRSGKCPKCGSTEIYQCQEGTSGGGIGWGDNYNFIRVTAKWGGETTGKWETYICVICGYFENYILDRGILEQTIPNPQTSWKKVPRKE